MPGIPEQDSVARTCIWDMMVILDKTDQVLNVNFYGRNGVPHPLGHCEEITDIKYILDKGEIIEFR